MDAFFLLAVKVEESPRPENYWKASSDSQGRKVQEEISNNQHFGTVSGSTMRLRERLMTQKSLLWYLIDQTGEPGNLKINLIKKW